MSTTDIAVIPFALGSFRASVDDGIVHNAAFTLTPERARRDRFGVYDALRDYFAGDVDALDSIDVTMRGTPFQCEVWRELRRIPAGTTISYGELARWLRLRHRAQALAARPRGQPAGHHGLSASVHRHVAHDVGADSIEDLVE